MIEVRELGRILAPMEKTKSEMEENWFMKPFNLLSESNEGG
jgi:hypothetical protein